MRNFMLAAFFTLCSTASARADAPTYRAEYTATGKNPTVTVTPQAGDAIVVFALSDQHSSGDLGPHTATDDTGGTYWDQYCASAWARSGNKYAKLDVLVRGQLASNTDPIHITVGTSGHNAAVVAIAVSGLSAIDDHPPVNGCGTLNTFGGSVRQVKNNSVSQQFAADETPSVPKFGQAQSYATTSMTFAVVANEEQAPSPQAPSGWTQRATAGMSGAKSFGLSVSTRDSGFTGSTITWSSSTPTAGNALAVELQAIQ